MAFYSVQCVVTLSLLYAFWGRGAYCALTAGRVSEGVLFKPRGGVRFVDVVHTVVVKVDLNSIYERARVIWGKLDGLKGENALTSNGLYTGVQGMIDQAIGDLDSFTEAIEERKRSKRNIAGDIVSSLFGLVTESELRDLTDQVNSVQNRDSGVINKLVSSVNVNTENIQRVGDAVIRLENATENMAVIARDYRDVLIPKIMGNFALHSLRFAVISLDKEIQSLIRETEMMILSGRISPLLVKPEVLLGLLQGLQTYGDLVHPPTFSSLPKLYGATQVLVRKQGRVVYLFVRLPVVVTPTLFNLFEILPLWVSQGDGWGRKVALNGKNIIISADGKMATEINLDKQCREVEEDYVCLSEGSFVSGNHSSCALHLFNGVIGSDNYCQYLYTRSFDSQLVKLGKSYIVSADHDLDLLLTCGHDQVRERVSRGISKIKVKEGCSAEGDSFTIHTVSHSQGGDINVELIRDNLTVPVRDLGTAFASVKELNLAHLHKISGEMVEYLNSTPEVHLHRPLHEWVKWIIIVAVLIALLVGFLGIKKIKGWVRRVRRVQQTEHGEAPTAIVLKEVASTT